MGRRTTLETQIKTMVWRIIKISMFLITCTITSCSFSQDRNKQEGESYESTPYDNPVSELTQEQQSAFDALNRLQRSTDEMNRLYSTFPNIEQPCYPADTSFSITQSELLAFMKQFVSKHCQNLSKDMQDKLAKTSVLAQEEYTVLYCSNESVKQSFENGLSMSGTWVMPNILGRRDLIIVW